VSSDAVPNPSVEPGATPEQYRQRALLLADLGRYDEAAEELAAGLSVAPTEPDLLTTLARVHLAAEQPLEALTAAERAAAAAPDAIGPLAARAMALADLRRFAEAAEIGLGMLRRWPADAYAQRTGSALLSETRNGQDALNAAWAAVRLSPTDAETHLVLAVVAARLRLFDLAQQAYAEALDLDPALGDAQRDLGVVRLERRRWAKGLEEVADAAALAAPEPRLPEPNPEAAARADPEPPLIVSRPTGPVLDSAEDSAAAIRQAVLAAANATMVAALLVALMATASVGASRVWAAVVGVALLVAVGGWLTRRLVEPVPTALGRLWAGDRRLAIAAYLAAAAPLVIVAYALVSGPIPLVAAIVVAAPAAILARRHP
jgi:tetratricopeptide (TPR) repeat protein